MQTLIRANTTQVPLFRAHATRRDLLFLSLDWSRPKDLRRPLAMASIEAYFRKNQIGVVDAEFKNFSLTSPNFDLGDVLDLIDSAQPKFLALGAYIWNEQYVPELIRWTKAHHPKTKIILGGPQVTYGDSDLVNEYVGVDYFIKGEGEIPFTELIGILYRNDTPSREFLAKYAIYTPQLLSGGTCDRVYAVNLDELESPYLSQILPVEQNQAFIRWETLRRCPFSCSFCQYPLIGRKTGEINHRRLFQELRYFKEMKVREVNVLDPIFNLRPEHYLEICKEIEACGIEARFYFQCRLELLCKKDGEQFLRFCRDHDVWLEFGVQTFSEEESRAIERRNNYTKINKAIELLHQFDVPFDLHLIFGLPLQSLGGFLSNYDKAREARPRGLYVFPLNVLKGTNLYRRRDEWGYEFDFGDNNIFLKSNWMEKDEVIRLKEIADRINHQSKLD